MYQEGLGVIKNYEKALKWYTKSAQQNFGEALKNIGRMYHNGYGFDIDYEQALGYYTQAVSQNNAHAMNNIGVIFHNGEGVECDYAKAMEWYLKAADTGFGLSHSNIGTLYKDGLGVEQDHELAMKWFLKGSDLNDSNCMLMIGRSYKNGWGVQENITNAIEWLTKAAKLNNEYAMNDLASLYYKNDHGIKDHEQAFFWYEKSAHLGNDLGMLNLIEMYIKGWGTPQNFSKAFEWADKAIAQNERNDVTELVLTSYAYTIKEYLDNDLNVDRVIKYLYNANNLFNKSSLLNQEDFKEMNEICNFFVQILEIYIYKNNMSLAKKSYDKIMDLFLPIYNKYDFDIYLGFQLWHAARSYGSFLVKNKSYEKAIPILEYSSKYGIQESTELLSELYENGWGIPKDEEKSMALKNKAKGQSLKKFKIPCTYKEKIITTEFYIFDYPKDYPYKGIEDQVIWLDKARGGIVKDDVRDSFIKLHNIAKENDVSFPDLCMYALGKED